MAGYDLNTLNVLGQQQGQFAPMAGALGATSPAPFTWGAGGTQLSPEQLALRQKFALQNQQADYSPIASPFQGLARVAQNVMGALDQRDLDKQSAAQQAQSNSVLQALAGSDPATVNPSLVAAALQSSDNQVQAFGKDVFDKAHPKTAAPNEFQQYLIASGVQPGTPEWERQNALRAQASYDPIVNVTLPTGVFAGPRSMLPSSGGAGAAQTTKVLPNGKTAYFVNGDWYDNPEGK